MASGGRLNLLAVWSESNLENTTLNYSPRFDYIIKMARLATQEEIERFSHKSDDEAYP